MKRTILIAVMAMCCASAQVRAAALMEQQLIFPRVGEHCHGSSITELPNGDLLVVWFQGSGERNANDPQSAYDYRRELPALIDSWRRLANGPCVKH